VTATMARPSARRYFCESEIEEILQEDFPSGSESELSMFEDSDTDPTFKSDREEILSCTSESSSESEDEMPTVLQRVHRKYITDKCPASTSTSMPSPSPQHLSDRSTSNGTGSSTSTSPPPPPPSTNPSNSTNGTGLSTSPAVQTQPPDWNQNIRVENVPDFREEGGVSTLEARSIKNKISELQNNCNAHDIILIAEMWLSCKDTRYLKGSD
jgi:hypothetical protein